jgi:hypothetical protein
MIGVIEMSLTWRRQHETDYVVLLCVCIAEAKVAGTWSRPLSSIPEFRDDWDRYRVGIAHTIALKYRLDGPGSIPGSSFFLVFVFCYFCVLYLVFYLLYLVFYSLHLYCTVKFCEICCFFVRCMFCFLAMYVHFLFVRPIFVTLPPGISPIAVNK